MKSNYFLTFLCSLCLFLASNLNAEEKKPLNLLLITVDDMSCDSVGVYGCELEGITPVMDRLASQSLRFDYAHVTVGNCNPCRNVMFSGLISHNNKVEGFYKVTDPGWPHMVDLLKDAGYYAGIRGKVTHSSPYQPYDWDEDLTTLEDGSKAHIKDAKSYGESTARGIANAKKQAKPFFLSVNISDPHKPFWSQVRGGGEDPYKPSRIFSAEEVPVPGFLFEDEAVREELALYYSSVRRADDCLNQVLLALKKSGEWDNTMIVFLSDHGMPLPFAKTQLYHHSTRTPLMVRIPGVTKAGSVDKRHMVSVLDLLPTVMDALGVKKPARLDGRSFYPVLKGQKQADRDFIIKQYHENSGRSRDPMRAIQTKTHLYLFNPWSNGERIFATATNGTVTCKRMIELAKNDKELNERLNLYRYRVQQELYQVKRDPDCLQNLIGSSNNQRVKNKLVKLLEEWMVGTGDPILECFRKREDSAFVEAYVQKLESESEARRKASAPKPKTKKKKKS
ncbi:MAG: sulfatase [Verrucomicrobiota bacterium]|nr:sulfatase [Verrucomicrobiota bacterium]